MGDCSTQNSGCNGGVVQYALNYVKSNRGIDTESSYPYEGRQGSCRYSSAYSAGVSVSCYMSIRRGDESNLLSAVSSNGPVSVCINASSSGFQFYKAVSSMIPTAALKSTTLFWPLDTV